MTTQHDTEKRHEHFSIWPIFFTRIQLQMGKSFNVLFNFMFFHDPSRSELIRPGLAVRVVPVRLLYTCLFKDVRAKIFLSIEFFYIFTAGR